MTSVEASAGALEMVIGLEVHCQLRTASKLFCPCPVDASAPEVRWEAANTRICPVCTGQPGALPVLNRRAVELAFQAGLALGCRFREISVFARKNYFYPDLPKGYQISQYDEPFAEAGALEIPGPPPRRVGIHRVHMEEDAGKLVHDVGSETLDCSLADFNRAGVPLIEIVSEPELRSAEEAHQYLTALKAVLQYIGVSRCDMEKGEMRCDANVSVRIPGTARLGTKAEIKNLNSFRGVRDALDYEYRRQCGLIREGGRVIQETRLWDAERCATEPMRSKEEAHDYRYFPEPDLVPLRARAERLDGLRESLPELPAARRSRFASQYGLSEYDAGVLTSEKPLADYFEASLSSCGSGSAKTAANWIGTELLGKLNASGKSLGDCPVSPERLGELVALLGKGILSSKLAKEVFAAMWESGRPAGEIVSSSGLAQVSDEGRVAEWAAAAMAENPDAVADFKSGKERAIGAIVGAVMRKSKGKANPDLANRIIRERLK